MDKNIIYNNDACKELESGMNILAKAVSLTLGPKGKNVILEHKFGRPQIVNDGITIAKSIELRNTLENMGVVLIRQAAMKTNDSVGDGTTTTTVLAHAIVKEGLNSIASGFNPLLIKKGLDKSMNFITGRILEYSRPIMDIKDLTYIASLSAGNNLLIGNLISSVIKKVGPEGIISLEESKSMKTSFDIKEGLSFEKGYMSVYFLSSPEQVVISQENPLILLIDKKIKLVQQELVPLLERVALKKRSLLIIANDIEKEALSTLILNKSKGIIDVVAVRTPGFGDRRKTFLDDIALLTNATVISEDIGLSLNKLSFDCMGSAKRTIISKGMTTIISEDSYESVKLSCENIRKQIKLSNNSYDKEKLRERLRRLSGGAAVIKVGALTDTEMVYSKLRFEDAINATKAAIEEGIVPGGGSTLAHLSYLLQSWACSHLLSDELVGAQILAQALLVPLRTIVQNSGQNGSIVVERLRGTSFNMGYDAEKNQYVDMYLSGIIDPSKVTRLALQNAVSIASIILTTGCIIENKLTNQLKL